MGRIRSRGGLPALKKPASLGALPGLETPPEELGGGFQLAFQRGGGDAVLVLSGRLEGSVARLAALAILFGGIGAALLLRRRRART